MRINWKPVYSCWHWYKSRITLWPTTAHTHLHTYVYMRSLLFPHILSIYQPTWNREHVNKHKIDFPKWILIVTFHSSRFACHWIQIHFWVRNRCFLKSVCPNKVSSIQTPNRSLRFVIILKHIMNTILISLGNKVSFKSLCVSVSPIINISELQQ